MKKLILLFACSLIGLGAYAQFGGGVKLPLAVGDTLGRNTGANQVNKYISATGGYSGGLIQVVLKSQSGTPAGGISLYQSLDGGTTYNRLLPASAADSLVLGASALSYTWKITGPLPPLIKVHATNSGTQNTQVNVWYVLRKYQSQ
jgi:hypothetical protein